MQIIKEILKRNDPKYSKHFARINCKHCHGRGKEAFCLKKSEGEE